MTNNNQPKQKSKINNALVQSFGAYYPIYDIEVIDDDRKIWKGRPLKLNSRADLGISIDKQQIQAEWIFFHRNYDNKNDWDLMYPELPIDDLEIVGVEFLLVPKEKLLFKYDGPSKEGIIIPPMGVMKKLGRR